MTARHRLQKRLRDIDEKIDVCWRSIHLLTSEPFKDLNEAHSTARKIIADATAIHQRMAERREVLNALNLLQFHVGRHPEDEETFGI